MLTTIRTFYPVHRRTPMYLRTVRAFVTSLVKDSCQGKDRAGTVILCILGHHLFPLKTMSIYLNPTGGGDARLAGPMREGEWKAPRG